MKRKNFLKALLGLPLALKAADTLTEGDVKMKEFMESEPVPLSNAVHDHNVLYPGRGIVSTCVVDSSDECLYYLKTEAVKAQKEHLRALPCSLFGSKV